MRPVDPVVTGQAIPDPVRRQEWVDLVTALQLASEKPGGPLEGWVFHGTDGLGADAIVKRGLQPSEAGQYNKGGLAKITMACHFGRVDLAAFFAESRAGLIGAAMSLKYKDAYAGMTLFGAPLAQLAECGEMAADVYMMTDPVHARMRYGHRGPDRKAGFGAADGDWRAGLEYFDAVLVLGSVPSQALFQFRHVNDFYSLLAQMQEQSLDVENEPVEAMRA